ncbi:MAG: DNA/RNA nuclease SfsA [Clostridia bacterium]|nr:DNA/RNA nuclease SfsA [Clostridia bacterium]
MKYRQVNEGVFLARPNRFVAEAEIGGEKCVCHVKNTGRCRELLRQGVRVSLVPSENPARKTKYDLVAVEKEGQWVNIDSQAPNRVFDEWVRESAEFAPLTRIRSECTYQSSRFDFYLESGERRIFAEVKGVTLEEGGTVLFPDAPTERGVKHIRELIEARRQGYEAYLFFVVQLEKCHVLMPNRATHPAFADALADAVRQGVRVRALRCRVTADALWVIGEIPCRIE